jgi:hypothetical protein
MPDRHTRLYRRDGIVVLPRILPAARLQQLSAACDHVLAQQRAASVTAGHTSTHVTGLLAPEYFLDRPELLEQLASFASSPEVVGLVRDLGQPLEGEPNLRSLEYFHEPSTRDYDGAWHRDGDDVQLPRVAAHGSSVPRSTLLRLRVPFAPDDHLEYVPGSHLRDDTAAELHARRGQVRNQALDSSTVRVVLEPGDVCLFDTWGVHRGRYRRQNSRRTLDLLFRFGERVPMQLTALLEYARAGRRSDLR